MSPKLDKYSPRAALGVETEKEGILVFTKKRSNQALWCQLARLNSANSQ
jgi:hypothetical protein